jgi:type III pantothenate kinase
MGGRMRMNLALDVGNSQIYAGVFEGEALRLTFRKASKVQQTSDELGLFLRAALRENAIDPKSVERVAICSVVPDLIYTLKACCRKYFDLAPFILQSGVKTGLNIRYRNPAEVGADRVANAIGAAHIYPGRNMVVVDFGTATTFCAITASKEYLGGLILPGLRIAMEALEKNTARLPAVEIIAPERVVGRSTVESIQSGLYFGNVAVVREVSRQIREQHFSGGPAMVIGTGGFSRLFENAGIFDAIVPDLVLIGVMRAMAMNCDAKGETCSAPC